MTNISVTKPYQKRRRYSKELKARIVAECLKPMELPPWSPVTPERPGNSVYISPTRSMILRRFLGNWLGQRAT